MSESKNRRVAVTGMATVNPLGDSLDIFYENLLAGKSGVKTWESLDMSGVECKIGGDIGNYDTKAALETLRDSIPPELHKKLRKLFRTSTFSNRVTMICALRAILDSGLPFVPKDPFRVSSLVGGHNFNSRYIIANMEQFREEPAFVEPLFGVEALDPNIAACVSEILGARGPAFTLGGACASGNLALRDGFRDIITGESDIAVVSGAIFDMTAADIHAMAILNSVVINPYYQTRPEEASRPFDTKRCGFIPSHGAGTLIIEELSSAKNRGARIYAELIGVQANANANHLPAPSSESQIHLIRNLLKYADVSPEQVDYVNCHATGTPLGDIEEITAIQEVFKDHSKNMKVNAPKSMLGHVCWSAPIVESIGGLLQMQNGKLHPTINIAEQDPRVEMDVCANNAVDFEFEYMLKNSFGFGGINCCSLFKRYSE